MSSAASQSLPAAAGDDVVRSIRARIDILGLDLGGLTVLTEAATGPYAATAAIAAAAGATVFAFARDTTRYGSFADAAAATLALGARLGVADRIRPVRALDGDLLGACDIVTNSGHLRPLDRTTIFALPRQAVIALMFEAWEFREGDLDAAACAERGIRIAAVNERHPKVAVFPFLGPLAAQLLATGGIALPGARVAVLCDNPFAPYLEAGLAAAGADVATFAGPDAVPAAPWDAVLVALNPFANPALGATAHARLDAVAPDALVAQFWGDIDRDGLRGRRIVPTHPPRAGHMAVLLSDLGHEPVVRLQAGGLRAAEIVLRGGPGPDATIAEHFQHI